MALSTPAISSKPVGIGLRAVLHCDPTGLIFPGTVRPFPIDGQETVATFPSPPLLIVVPATDGQGRSLMNRWAELTMVPSHEMVPYHQFQCVGNQPCLF